MFPYYFNVSLGYFGFVSVFRFRFGKSRHPHIGIVADVKQMSWDGKSADTKYLATMAKRMGLIGMWPLSPMSYW